MGTSPSKEQERDPLAREQAKPASSRTLHNASLTEDESCSNTAPGEQSSPDLKQSKRKKASGGKTPKRKNKGGNGTTKLNGNGLAEVEAAPSSIVLDEAVQVNLAMADLMAYLQVVATNSQNLPMTRRDDPEVRRAVSTLSPDDYARKSAAFIPADVRVIAGSFSKYGRVWDLPTSEEYSAEDGAQEPGRSYGGACCNAMLKVLYDAANEAADAAHEAAATDAIFDDDDDESLLSRGVDLDRNRTFDSLVLGTLPTTISWAELLRKMKAETHEIEYVQVPNITTTRKFDLNKPFRLLPEGFDPKKNTMRSLLIGCNYHGTPGAELKASHDDVRSMKDYIVNVHGFPEARGLMTVLLDDDKHKHPTHLNIVESMKALAEQSQPGDVVFIQFSGHGGRVLEDTDAETYDEIIAPSDYKESGLIRDTLIFKILLAPMRYGVTVTMLIDTCDTGMMLDLPYVWSTKSERRGSHAKLAVNNDFSFVRFLKVVKTLYESSTFTQLGKTVGSALNIHDEEEEEEETIIEESSLNNGTMEEEENTLREAPPPQQSAILKALAACTAPDNIAECADEAANRAGAGEKKKSRGDHETRTLDTRDAGSQTLLEQVMSCTFIGHTGGDDSDDDDETYGRSTAAGESYEDDTLGETTTYDSITDDGYESHRRRRRQNKSRRR